MTRVSLALLATIALAPLPAHAQSAEAEVLFREGRNLIKQGKLEPGCDKLAASERLETSVGTLLNLGDCNEKLGRNATAWGAFRKAESLAKRTNGDDKRRLEAGRRATALEDKLTMLIVEVKQPVDGLVVTRDGEIVDPAAWNSALPVDPDNYTIVAEAPGYKPWRTEIPISAKLRRRTVSIPKLERAPLANVPAPPPPAARVKVASIEPVPVVEQPQHVVIHKRGRWTATRGLAVTLAFVGAGAVGGGVYFGLRSNDLESRADARCPLVACDDVIALRLNDDAREASRSANALYIGGGVAIAAATLLWFIGAPSEHTVVAPTVGANGAGVSFGGWF